MADAVTGAGRLVWDKSPGTRISGTSIDASAENACALMRCRTMIVLMMVQIVHAGYSAQGVPNSVKRSFAWVGGR